jgi:hypothetical protein
MAANKKIVSASRPTPNHLDSFFGAPPLLKGEDPEAYKQLLAGVTGDVAPADVLERIWTYDVVQQTWEIIRWQRLKTALLNNAMTDALVRVLVGGPLKLLSQAQQLAQAWAAGKSSEVKRVEQLLASAGMTIDHAQARALEVKLEIIDGLDRLITSAEIRRSATFREIDRHRDRKQFAKALQTKIAEIEDAEFEAVTTAPQQQPSSDLPAP